jgi:hypothetical protein
MGREEVMSNQKALSTVPVTWVVIPSLALLLCAGSAKAQNNLLSYTFLMASGFLCDQGDSATCPAAVKSVNGDSYEMSGAGTFDPQNKSVKAAGTFTHKAPNGNELETGVWIASELVGFDSYGIAPGALRQHGAVLGRQPIGPKGFPRPSGPMPTGGLAVFRIRLLPTSGGAKTATLQVNCALGKVPPDRQMEGIRLSLEKNGAEFLEELSGRVLFVSMPPEVSAPSKIPSQEMVPDSAKRL